MDVDPHASDTVPLPVVETVATPAAPEQAPTAAVPAEPVAPVPGRRRDLTPLVLGLLCAAAVLALALSALAFARRDSPAAPTPPPGAEATSTTGATGAPASPATTGLPAASSRSTVPGSPVPAPGGGKGKGGTHHD